MQSIVCNNCGTSVPNTANFCNECGNTLKCKECKTLLNKGDKFCGECGAELKTKNSGSVAPNTFSFHRKGDEISYDVGLSNEVGKEGIKSLIESIAQSNLPLPIDINTVEIEKRRLINHIPPSNTDDVPAFENQSHDEPASQKVDPNLGQVEIKYPHIDDLLHKRKYSEMEWVLVFTFIESGYGNNTITREQVREAYLGKRKNESRVKNFTGNWNGVHKTFLDTASDGVFRIEFEKHQLVSDFVLGKINGIIKGAYENKKPSAAKKGATEQLEGTTAAKPSKSSKQITLEDFDVVKNATRPSLQETFDKFKPSGNKDVFGFIAYYICSLNRSENFTAGNIDFAYRILKLTRKNHLIQLVNNVKNETQWFEGIDSGVWKLTRLGTVQLEEMFSL